MNCLRTIQYECLMPVYLEYAGMNEEAVLEKLRSTDLRETCG